MPTMKERINSTMNKVLGTNENTTSHVPGAAATDSQLEPVTDSTLATQETGDTQIVSGTFVDNSAPVAAINIGDAFSHTNDFRKVVESFDEDKQTPLEWIVQKVYTFLAYVVPTLIALIVGLAIGDAFSNKWDIADAYNVFAHVISIGIELALVMLMLGAVATFKRALKDRSQIGLFITLAVLFLLFSVLNSFAQLFLLEKHITISTTNIVPLVAVVFRSFGSMIIDLICAIYLGVTGVKSLQKYLQDKKAQIAAIRDVNQVEIEISSTKVKAAMDMQSAMMDMQSKAQRASTWNEIESLQSKQMIEQAKKNMRNAGDDGGSYRRNRY